MMIRSRQCRRLLVVAAIALVILLPCALISAREAKSLDRFSREEVQTASRFNHYLYTLFVFKELALVLFLGLVAWSRLASSYHRDVEKLVLRKKGLVLPVYTFFILVMIRLVILPLDAVRDLVLKSEFGLTRQGVAGWLADQAKSFFVADIWYIPLIVLAYVAMPRLRRTWWLICAAALGLGLIACYSLAPHLIEPLFYRVTPVRSQALRSRLNPLLQRAGLDPGVLYQADSSRRTTEVNAYASGLFLGRRIVLYDVLAQKAEPSEIEFVVAHEIAHWRHNHIMKGIALATAGAAGVFLLTGTLLTLTARKVGHARGGRHGPDSLPVFFFWLHILLFLTMPPESAISRHFERTADRYALELTQDPQSAVRLFEKVARKNLADLNPPSLARFWLYNHPPILERIDAALRTPGKSRAAIEPQKPAASPPDTPSAPALGGPGLTADTPLESHHLSREGAKNGKED